MISYKIDLDYSVNISVRRRYFPRTDRWLRSQTRQATTEYDHGLVIDTFVTRGRPDVEHYMCPACMI